MEQKEVFNKRGLIDFLRGIAIFLMLWGHCIQYCGGAQFDFFEDTGFKIIYSFHMPFFMLISGYLFFFSAQKRGTTELIEYKAKSLLYPILMCAVLELLLTVGVDVLLYVRSLSALKEYAKMILGRIPLTSLWFLWSVLVCGVVVALAVKPFHNIFVQALLLVAGLGVVGLFPNWEMNVWMYPYFVIGYLYARNRERLAKFANVFSVVCVAAFVFMLFFFRKNNYIYVSGILGGGSVLNVFKNNLFRWSIGLFGSVAVAWCAKWLYGAISGKKAAFAVEALGKYSLAMYALSVSLLSYRLQKLTGEALSSLVGGGSVVWIYDFLITPLIAVAYAFLIFGVIKLMQKGRIYRLIFGR